jgi:hypothetical protein
MIRTLAVNCAPIHVCSKDARINLVETALDEMVMGVVWALCEIFLLIRQQNHSALSINVLGDALQRFYQRKGIY